MSGSSNDGGGSSWTSRFLKVASAAAATAAVAGGLYAVLSSSSANSEHEVPFGARRESKERDDAEPLSLKQVNYKEGATSEKWEKPEVGWVKLNVDGSREHNVPSAGCGGVLRDSSGKWLHGFAQKLDPNVDVHQTELQAILTGLKIASDKMNIKKLVLESDSNSAVSMVENGVKLNHRDYKLVEQIRTKLHRFDWEVRLVAISNEANRVADKLANNARNLSSHDPYKEYSDSEIPSNCVQFLQKDEMGV